MKRKNYKSQPLPNLPRKPLFIVLSGPSGAGKDAILTRMKQLGYPLEYITTVTTRPPRAGEKNNINYHFVSTQMFQKMIERNQLLEWANVYGNWYGVPKEPVKQALDRGQDAIVKVDIQGAATIKRILPQAVFIFLMTPSKEELIRRLKKRHTEAPTDLALRIKTAQEELEQLPLFDYVVVNKRDELDLAASNIRAIITAEKCRVTPREITL